MAFLRYALPAMAVAGSAVAQCGSGATTTIQNSGDASEIASCTTYDGSIAIETGTTDDIDFGSLRSISGSLIVQEVDRISSIGGSGLESIGDSFTLDNVQTLSTLNFPQLTEVKSIEWIGLPALQGLSFTSGIQSVESLSIQNTNLGSLEGIDLETVDTFFVANNVYLTEINMQLANVETSLQIAANGEEVEVEFPNMEWAFNMTFRNCSRISLPSLAAVNGSLGFYTNYFESLAAPNLTTIGGGLSFVSNEELTNASFPELKTVSGGLQLANNTALEEVTGFPSLTRVGGALDINGNFSEVEIPELDDVRGAMNLQSSENIDEICSHFQGLKGDRTIKGPYTCAGERSNPQGQGSLPDGTSSGSGSSDSPNPANKAYISGATGVMGVIAAIFGML